MSAQQGTASARLEGVRDRIAAACAAAGRPPEEVHLLAVSKRHPPEAIRAMYALGVRDFGENYAQELVDKAAALGDLPELRWHFIGHLQSNKAGPLAAHCHAVHSVSSARAGRALGRRAHEEGGSVRAMLQVNVAGEAQKSGVGPDEVPGLVRDLSGVEGLELCGLMTIPPADDPAAAERCYATLASLAASLGLRELSMGMSADLEQAIAHGATWVRVGTDLFGPR